MARSDTSATRLKLPVARQRDPLDFDIVPDGETCAALAAEFDLKALRKVRLQGTLHPQDRADWRLEARLGATIVQPCDITLDPVTTRIDEAVARRYVADLDREAPSAEQEMPEDVDEEPLPATLDLMAVLTEALSLAIPAFPRAPNAGFGKAAYAEPGAEPIHEDDLKPFAGLRDAMKGGRT